MFLPNLTALLSTRTGRNSTGEPTFSSPVSVRAAIVHLAVATEKTSVRTDSSASRGNAEHQTAEAKILLDKSAGALAVTGHKLLISGVTLRAIRVEPRNNVHGVLDHYECDYEPWVAS